MIKSKEKIKIEIPRYWVEQVDDYHEFDSLKENYRQLGIKCKFQEVGFDRFYCAVFWVGLKPVEFVEGRLKALEEDDDQNE